MAGTAGYGVLQIIPSMRGIDAAIRRQLTSPTVTRAASDAGRAMGGRFADGISSAGSTVRQSGTVLTAGVTAPVAALGVSVVKTSGDFEASMNRVKAISGATGKEFSALTQLAKDLGSSTQFSASEAADALGFLSMAGFTAKDSMTALPGVLNLAAAGNLGLADAADIASNVLSGYGFEAKDIGRLNDVMAKTFTSANVDMRMLGESFKFVAPVAASAGIEFEEASAAIGLLGNAGIQGSEAGTALRGSIARLLKPTAEVEETLNKLGVSVTDSSGKLLPLVDIVGQLEKSGADTADMMTIFGLEAGPAMQALVSQGSDALGTLTQNLRDSGGTAENIATVQMEGFNGALASLRSAWEGLMIAIGDSGILNWATQFTDRLTGLISGVSATDSAIFKFGSVVALVAAAVGPALVVLGFALSGIGTSLGVLLSPLGLVVAGAVLLGGALAAAYATSRPFRDLVNDLAGTVLAGLVATFNDVKAAAQERLLPALQGLWTAFQTRVLPPLSTLVQTVTSRVLPILRTLGVFIGGTLIPVIVEIGRWLLTYVVPPVLSVASAVGGPLLTALGAVVKTGLGFVTWLRDLGVWLVPVGVLVAGLTLTLKAQAIATAVTTGVFRVYRGVILAWAAAQRIATAAQWALNAAQRANPIGLIITLVVALVAAIVVAYKRSETFRRIVQAAFDGVLAVGRAVGAWFAGPFVDFFTKTIPGAFRAVLDWVRGNWPWLLGAITGPIGLAVVWIVKNWDKVVAFFGDAFRTIKRVMIDPLVSVFTKTIPGAARTVRDRVSAAWTALRDVLAAVFRIVRDRVFAPLGRFFTATIPGWGRTVRDRVSGAWRSLRDGLHGMYTFIRSRVFNPIGRFFTRTIPGWARTMKDKVVGFFTKMKDGLGAAWDGIKDAAKGPVNWVIRHVWNRGIVPTWDKIAGWIPGVPELGKLELLEAGGTVPAAPGMFNRPTAIVGEGNPAHPEFVIPTDPKYRSRALALWQAAGGQLMEDGGILGTIKKAAGKVVGGIKSAADFLSDPVGAAAKLLDPLLGGLKDLSGTSFEAMVAGIPRMAITGLKDLVKDSIGSIFGGGDGGGINVGGSGVQRWTPLVRQVLAMLGAPASALNAVLTRIRIESGGNPQAINNWDINARNGIASRGLMQTIPPTFAAYAGPFRSRGIFDPLANIYAGVNYAMHRYGSDWIRIMTRPGGYDNGGMLPPGLSAAYNGTRRPERVLTDRQWQAIYSAARGGDAPPVSYTINARTADFSVRDLDLLQRQQEARARVGRPQ